MMWDSSAAFMASCNMVWMPMMPDPGVIFATESGGVVLQWAKQPNDRSEQPAAPQKSKP